MKYDTTFRDTDCGAKAYLKSIGISGGLYGLPRITQE